MVRLGATAGAQPFTIFTVWLMRLGVRVTHGRPYHPQTQGKDERFHRTFNAEVLSVGNFRDLPECQRAFDVWWHVYNYERPHQALDLDIPSSRYCVSPRPFPDHLPEIQYGPDDIVRKVDPNGIISFKGCRFRVGKACCGQPLALRPTDEDGVLSLHFCTQQIGAIDLGAAYPACGLVDNAKARCPQGPQAQQQQQQIAILV